MNRLNLHFCCAAAIVLAACATSDEPPVTDVVDTQPASELPWGGGDQGDGIVLADDLVIVDGDPCVVSVDVPADREVLTFEYACDPVDRGVEPGNVVVGSEGGGYLRRVVSVQIDGYSVTAWTEEASLAEAIVEGGFELSLGEDGERGLINLDNTVLFADEVYGSDVLFKLNRADLDITPLIDIDGHWSEGRVQSFDFDTSLEVSGELSALLMSSNGLRHKKNIDVWEVAWPFATSVGPLPVAGDVGVRASIGYRLDSPGQASVTAGAGGELRWGAEREYRHGEGWTVDSMDHEDWRLDLPDFEVSANARAQVYLRLSVFVRFFGSAGPELSADLATRVTADPGCTGVEWDANAGLVGRAKVTMNILDKFRPTKIFGTIDLTADLVSGHTPWPIGVPLPCAQEDASCGQLIEGDTSEDTWQAQLSGYSCNVGNYDAPEAIYEWTAGSDGIVEWALVDPTPTLVNHDVVVLDGALDLMTARCDAWGSNSVEFEAVAGHTYYLVVDGFDEDAGAFAAQLTCEDGATDGTNEGNPFLEDPWPY